MSHSTWTRVLLGLCLLFGFSAVAAAQSSSVGGKIQGTVLDEHKAPIAGAAVTITQKETGSARTTTTNDSGAFVVLQLEPGTYEVKASKEGFSDVKLTDIVVGVGSNITVNPELKVGQVSGEVVVTDAAPLIEVAKTEFSNTVDQKSVQDLPINGRRWSFFALLTPGVNPDGDFGLLSFRGISGLLNNNTVDGSDNNQAFFAEERGRTRLNYIISAESVREFQVNTSNYSAEFGRSAGGVVNSVTKSGGNTFHGSGFVFFRDASMNARNPLAFTRNAAGDILAVKPPDRRWQFGGSVGGPIVKDRAFFFFSYDQQRRFFPYTTAPGDPTFFDITKPTSLGGVTGCKATPTSILNPNCAAAAAFLLPKTGVFSRRGDQWIFFPKVDWNINSKNVFTASYNYAKWNSPSGIQTGAVITVSESANGLDAVRADILNLKLVSTISPRLLNEARFQWGRDFEFETPNAPGPNTSLGSNGISFGMPNFLPRPQFPDERRYQYVDNLSWVTGNHTLKFGMDINRVHDVDENLFNGGGSYSYTNLSTFANDLANPSLKQYSSYSQAFGAAAITFSTIDYSFFGQDEWRVRRNVTLSYGLRYEYESLPPPQRANPALPLSTHFNGDTNNFGPRVGVAWDMFSDGKTVVRAGGGVFYGRFINSSIANMLLNTAGANSQINFSITGTNRATVGPTYPNVLSGPPNLALLSPSVTVLDPTFVNPQIYQTDLTLEQEVSRNIAVSGSYLMSRGLRLPTFVDINLPAPAFRATIPILDTDNRVLGTAVLPYFGTTLSSTGLARPDPNFFRIIAEQSTIDSIYHAMVLQFKQKNWRGMSTNINFTWSRAIDTGQTSTTFSSSFSNPVNSFNQRDERAVSNFDARKRFVVYSTYDIPFLKDNPSRAVRVMFAGWKLNNIIQYSDGRPFTGTVASGSLGSFRETTTGPLIRNIGGGYNGSNGSLRAPFVGRNSFRQPSITTWDIRIGKDFKITETSGAEFIFEAFNLLNKLNVTNVNSQQFSFIQNPIVADRTLRPNAFQINPSFGTPSAAGNTLYQARQVQFALRFHF